MQTLIQKLAEASAFIKARLESAQLASPKTALVLGSGLGALVERFEPLLRIPFAEIPHYAPARMPGHAGQLSLVSYRGCPLFVCEGRIHTYEGYSAAESAFLVEALCQLGIEQVVLTAAVGAIRVDLRPGQLVLLRDQINLTGLHAVDLGDPPASDLNLDMLGLYAQPAVLAAALPSVVYLGTHGPELETPAEIRAFRQLGADVVGMSVVHEACAAHLMGATVVGLVVVSNMAAGLVDPAQTGDTDTLGDFRAVAAQALPALSRLLPDVIK
ncbi:MAG: purine-nucleoside phosphorylase [Coriobacteriales bacterium]|jgi:purine-nucleoside phosphorylase|nr:purine-nucleoside phosphorylase [Coriobacteriales bacterium]